MSSAQPTPSPRPPPSTANTQVKVIDSAAGRILCLADIRGKISAINDLAKETGAKAVIHTGDFGFFDNNSLERINDRTLRHLILYSPLISPQLRQTRLGNDAVPNAIRHTIFSHSTPLLSEFPLLQSGTLRLSVPVYTVWGACEDVQILEKFRSGEYDIENLTILDEATTRCLDIGGVKLRLFGLGGALVMHKMFDNGEGRATIAGGQGTMWTTALQIGELVDTAQRTYDSTETRLLITHASPGREGLLAQLGLALKADLFVSGGLHFRYSSSYNEFSVQSDLEAFRTKILSGQVAFNKVWDSVKVQVEGTADENQRQLLEKALSVVARVPQPTTAAGPGGAAGAEEPAWKNCWHWNLCDAAYGNLVLDIKDGRISADLKSQGFNYAYRRNAPTTATGANASAAPVQHAVVSASSPAPGPSQLKAQPAPHASPVPVLPAGTGAGSASSPVHAVRHPPIQSRPVNGSPIQGQLPQQTKKVAKPEGQKERELSDKEKSVGTTSKPSTPNPVSDSKPAASTSVPDTTTSPAPAADAASPGAGRDGASSTGGRTPTTRRPPRNPFTLFMNRITDLPVTEAEIKDFFGEAKSGITFIKIPINHHTRQQRGLAYVEFGDEETMKAALVKHAQKLKTCIPRVVIADHRDPVESDGSTPPPALARGGGPFRGGMRGGRGFARNSVAAAAAASAGPGGRPAGRGKGENGITEGGRVEGGPSGSPAPSGPAEPKERGGEK
ncbi:hypothetical protein DACRYDRAFT_112812 [Dacryopinax primogenitus]|uniref:RRM domain-containing protein n=1 Tax=Dacryopinax primogenitus (strain DJM 731) TaxID=1858805 RepID=M5GF67_DACPD|nr:uncharacterized protein DACRYDRAFT_112812 [Dacryopinax primogenitus]EJU06007.1 hypothetical protein DACRYDRAFT_112812 [Dacryopinax primogenitus]